MFKKILPLISVLLIGFFLFLRFRLGLTKLFDIDEFAHLHWAYNLFSGKNPYTDFFYFLPPFFLYILSPLFLLAKGSIAVLLYGRVVMFMAFLLTCVFLYFIVKKIRNNQTAILAVLIFSFLPIPLDKWIEIRPDPVATLAMIVGIYFLVRAIHAAGPAAHNPQDGARNLYPARHLGVPRTFRHPLPYFLSGLFYSLAVVILPKMVLYAIVAFFIVFAFSVIYKKSRVFYSFVLGGILPIILTLLLYISYGNFNRAIQLTTEVSTRATNLLGSRFPIPPNFLFYPNDVYFGAPGESMPWKINLVIWLAGIVYGIVSLVSFLNSKDKKESLVKLLISASFLVNLIVFVQFLKLRHGQYLVPLSVFIAYYTADLIIKILNNFKFLIAIFTFAFLIFTFAFAGKEMYDWKLRWTNEWVLKYYSNLYNVIGSEKVLDLTGETVYGNDGYYFCCVPYGQYAEALNFPYLDLETAIQKNKIKYVFVQTIDRLSVLPPEHADIIRKYFVLYDLPGLNNGLMILKDNK